MRRIAVVVQALLLLGASDPGAQASVAVQSARTAALEIVRAREGRVATTPIVADSAELWRTFVRCRAEGAVRTCALSGASRVTMVLVHLPTPDSAAIEVREYEMIHERCPSRIPIVPPKIGIRHVEYWSMNATPAGWKRVGRVTGIAC